MSQRRAARLIPVDRMTLRYEHHRDPQEALRVRLRELAGRRVRYGYRRLTVLLKREGWEVNAKRIYRLYTEEGLIVRTHEAQGAGATTPPATGPGCVPGTRSWSMDFVAQRLPDGRWIPRSDCRRSVHARVSYLHADTALSGEKVAPALDKIVAGRGAPRVDHRGQRHRVRQ